MKEIEKISSFQFFILVVMFVIGSSVLYIPSVLAAAAKEDAWIVAIIGGLLGITMAFLYGKIAIDFQGKNLIQIYESVFGKVISKLFTFQLVNFCLIMASLILRGIGDFMVTQIMPETPIEVIMGLFILIIIFALKFGVEVFGRTAEIFFPWIIFLFIFGAAMITPDMQITRVQPILDNGLKPIIKGTYSNLGFPYLECVLLLMLVPHWNDKQSGKKAWIIGTMVGSLILFITVFLAITVLGSNMTATQTYVTYILAKKMGIPHVFERMEVVIAIFWILTIFYKLLICFFCLVKSAGSIFTLNNEKILAYPLGIIILCTAIISGENIVALNEFSSNIWPIVAFQTGLINPLLIILIEKVKNRIKQKKQL